MQSHEKHEDNVAFDEHGGSGQIFPHPYNELFVWAVLSNMQKMALCFWKLGGEAMAKALVACKLYRQMAKYGDRRQLQDDIVHALKLNSE